VVVIVYGKNVVAANNLKQQLTQGLWNFDFYLPGRGNLLFSKK